MYPLIRDVALSTRDIHAQWRHRAWIIGSLIAGLDVTIVALAILFAQQLCHRRAAEDELRELVRTDELTGLNNRRAFEEVVQEEWRRAQRIATPLSTLRGRRRTGRRGALHCAQRAAAWRYDGTLRR
jgi:hypothetical protein